MLGLRTGLRTTRIMPNKAILLVGTAYIQGEMTGQAVEATDNVSIVQGFISFMEPFKMNFLG